eukprot:TRINITY_DN19397_c0_g2_i1.p1 TRINITY_DN19397_c0_g2~~TRINITY_DN19397_c0_g2_i1.p1  ORF type:complete len:213 (+),score=19.97 TRINITY_DN19397_c0_g2_i1:155-793(+)
MSTTSNLPVLTLALLIYSSWAGEVIVDNIRVQALSPSLVRIEPRGPKGFENRSTFTIVNRSFAGLPITSTKHVADGVVISTQHYRILIKKDGTKHDPSCKAPVQMTVQGSCASFHHPWGARVKDRSECCKLCEEDSTCMAWVFSQDTGFFGRNCWPLASFEKAVERAGHELGCSSRGCEFSAWPGFTISSLEGRMLYDSESVFYHAQAQPQC